MINQSKMSWKPVFSASLRCASGPVAGIISKVPLLLCMLFLAGCPSSQPPKSASDDTAAATPSNASITATPNPVLAGEGLGTTTITWDTKDASAGQVYVSENGKPEVEFASGTEGSQEAGWIQTGSTYEFRLYAGMERKTLLGTVQVTRANQSSTQ